MPAGIVKLMNSARKGAKGSVSNIDLFWCAFIMMIGFYVVTIMRN